MVWINEGVLASAARAVIVVNQAEIEHRSKYAYLKGDGLLETSIRTNQSMTF